MANQLSLFEDGHQDENTLLFSSKPISLELRKILGRSEAIAEEDFFVFDPPCQLSREMYKQFKTIVLALRGQWNSCKKRHEFPYDPTQEIHKILNKGLVPDTNPHSFFPTPSWFAKELCEEARIWNNCGDLYRGSKDIRVLEPSAGEGAIAREIRRRTPDHTLHVCEIDPNNRAVLKTSGFELVGCDFLSSNLTGEYHIIVMNPPFDLYRKHIEKAFEYLAQGGRLVSVVPSGFLSCQNRAAREFRNWVATVGDWYPVPPEESPFDTNVNVAVVSMCKIGDDRLREQEEPESGEAYNSFVRYALIHLENDEKVISQLARCCRHKDGIEELMNKVDDSVRRWQKQGVAIRWCDRDRETVKRHFLDEIKEE